MKRPTRLYVIDPDALSLDLSRRRLEEMPRNELIGVDFLTQVPRDIDFDIAIVATPSASRRAALEQLVDGNDIRHLILEKFLFQSETDYDAVSSLLRDQGIRAWVNCPRRVWASYRNLKQEFAESPVTSLNVIGGERYPIGTTAIHFLDLLAYLSGETGFKLSSDQVDREFLPSVRDGHVEFTGMLEGKSLNGSTFRYSCLRGESLPLVVTVSSSKTWARIDETAGYAQIYTNGRGSNSIVFTPELQSNVISGIAEDLLERGRCGLTTLAESIPIHLAILRALLCVWQEIDGPTDILPIT